MRPLLESMPQPREHRAGRARGIGHVKVSSMDLTGRVSRPNYPSSELTSGASPGQSDDTRGGEGRSGDRDECNWHVDFPLRFRGGLTRGGLDVTLELVRVSGGGELPAGTPWRDGAWGGPSAAVGTAGTIGAVVDVVETAMVFACSQMQLHVRACADLIIERVPKISAPHKSGRVTSGTGCRPERKDVRACTHTDYFFYF